eukprot:CAMPEP_0204359688 /NCGR_PEP_ID=MMETSP0469-20131031/37458_1 /ASSEMBLY_ACC=CAM_ASM_000384 /TAXON_ID=2969 /ORGANISM="Oxyrrhis marina" /LENGTH=31 /DNA_ID= /DNA_START= /DNA_END= /DNA_ORIENTATION=
MKHSTATGTPEQRRRTAQSTTQQLGHQSRGA